MSKFTGSDAERDQTSQPERHLSSKSDICCPTCQSPFEPDESKTRCPECGTEYHLDCWNEIGGCAVYGCSKVPPTKGREDIEIPVSYWGQEHKKCPSCGVEILAAAIRCRYCGAIFESSRPEEISEYNRLQRLRMNLPSLRRNSVLLFIFNALTCTAPFAAVLGGFWYSSHRKEIKTLPSIYSTLCTIGLAVGIGQTALIAIMAFLFKIFYG